MFSFLHRPLPVALALLALAAPLAGCDAHDAELDGALAADGAEDIDLRGGCAKCQFNSAQVNGFPISSLDLSGGANDHGVALRFLRDPDGNIYTMGVLGEELAAYDEQGLLRAHGEELLKWQIVLDIAGSEQSLYIVGRKQISSWAKGGAPLSVYGIAGEYDGEPLESVCPGQEFSAATVTILHGETYDSEHKTVDKIGDQWITLACVDEAAFKLKRLGYGPKGNQGPDGKHPTLAQRITTLKMLTADYCGTGQSFTEFHTPVYWMNTKKTITSSQAFAEIAVEARWDEHGAICIRKPRYADMATIQSACSIPLCPNDPKLTKAFEWQSSVPAPLSWKNP